MIIEMNQDIYYRGIHKRILTFQLDFKTIFNYILLIQHNRTQILNYIQLHIHLTAQENNFLNLIYGILAFLLASDSLTDALDVSIDIKRLISCSRSFTNNI